MVESVASLDESSPDTDESVELGFGQVIGRRRRRRLLNRSGHFNVRRHGLGFWSSLSLVHGLLTTTWPRFLGAVAASYLGINALFAGLYRACGPGALAASHGDAVGALDAFHFSVQTFATIGYGQIVPASDGANALVFLESLVGLLWVAMATGLIFARAVRPTTRVRFSSEAIVAPYRAPGREREVPALEFRLANMRRSQLFDLHVEVLVAWIEEGPAGAERRYARLELERDRVVFLPLSWTVVHALDERSPLATWNEERLARTDAEILVLLSAIDDATGQVVHARTSYTAGEIRWGARFRRIFEECEGHELVGIDLARLDEIEPAALPG